MKTSRDRDGLSIQDGDSVEVETSLGPIPAAVCSTKPHNAALEGCVLVEFENGTRQWMPGAKLKIAANKP